MVAKSLPISSGYPNQQGHKLAAFGQSDRSIYGKGQQKQGWHTNTDAFGHNSKALAAIFCTYTTIEFIFFQKANHSSFGARPVAAMIAKQGVEKTENWAKALVNNFARSPKGGDRDQIKAVAAGVCDVALVNNYYLAGMLDSNLESEVSAANKIKLFWPNQDSYGAHMNVSGAGILKSARHKREAIQLLEYLVSDKAQQWYADTNYEYSINPNIESTSILKNWGKFKADNLNLSLLGKHNIDAVLLMDRAGWK